MNSFNVLLTESVGVYVEGSARDYPDYTTLIAPRGTARLATIRTVTHVRILTDSSLRLLFTVLVP